MTMTMTDNAFPSCHVAIGFDTAMPLCNVATYFDTVLPKQVLLPALHAGVAAFEGMS